MAEKYFLTTPLYYVNDVPHIGHAYTTVAADVLARYKRQQGFDVFFLTGTDEHGQKIWKAAQEKNEETQQFVDRMAEGFKRTWQALGISCDDFIRTTEPRHARVVQQVFHILLQQGDIYKGEYEGWYCVPCESFWAEGELTEDVEGRKLCPDCGRETELLKEETYYFKLSKYQQQLETHLEQNKDFVQPKSRWNEIYQFVKQGLKDLSITRTAFPWGVGVPEDPKHVIYVWFDALINYISAPGFPDGERFRRYWPADVQLMGKEIVRFHAVIWPAMLMALDLPLPKKIFGHGWWTVEGKKMSKSKGNVVDPLALSSEFGVDPVRYFLLREVPFGSDGDFSLNSFISRYNADLANDLGNLLSRTLTMIEKYFASSHPPYDHQLAANDQITKDLEKLINDTSHLVNWAMDQLAFSTALGHIWQLISQANIYIEKQAPWTLAKNNEKAKLAVVLSVLIRVLDIAAKNLFPFMPETSKKIFAQLNLNTGRVAKGEPLFPRRQK